MSNPYPPQCADTTLMFLNHPHKAIQVFACAKAAPQISVEIKDLLLDSPDNPKFYPATTLLDKNELLLYKYNGRWLVLMGKDHVDDAMKDGSVIVKGRLISTPTLKKCRILPAVVETALPEPAVTPRWDNSANRGARRTPEREVRPYSPTGFRKGT